MPPDDGGAAGVGGEDLPADGPGGLPEPVSVGGGEDREAIQKHENHFLGGYLADIWTLFDAGTVAHEAVYTGIKWYPFFRANFWAIFNPIELPPRVRGLAGSVGAELRERDRGFGVAEERDGAVHGQVDLG